MKCLHCLWLPGFLKTTNQGLFFWAEDFGKVNSKLKSTKKHSFLVNTKELTSILKSYSREYSLELENISIDLRLPSKKNKPKPSLDFEGGGSSKEGNEDTVIKTWTVEGVILQSKDILDFFLNLSLSNETVQGLRIGDDIKFWDICTKFLLELVIRQRFIPGINKDDKAYYGSWLINLDNLNDAKKFRTLVKSMPPLCKSFSDYRNYEDEKTLEESILTDFFNINLDRFCKFAVSTKKDSLNEKLSSNTISENWLKSLIDDNIQIKRTNKSDLFYKEWKEWIEKRRVSASQQFRTSFWLEETDNDNLWKLSFFLQAVDEPSILIHFKDALKKKNLVVGERRLTNTVEQALSDLGYASNIFSPIEKALNKNLPTSCSLTLEEAYTFLSETSTLMEESGFGIIIPNWWNKQNKRVGISLNLENKKMLSSGKTGIGLGSVLDFNWKLALGEDTLTDEEFEKISNLKVPLVRIRGQWIELNQEKVKETISYLQSKKNISLAELLTLSANINPNILSVSNIHFKDEFKAIFDKLMSSSRIEDTVASKLFKGKLRNYQNKGVSWLEFLSNYKIGACLADDMGLGKTVQTIAFIQNKKENSEINKPILIICPTTIVGNWEREINRFAPSLKVMIHHGSDRAKGKDFLKNVKKNDIVISSYSLAYRDESFFKGVEWDMLILDEAQNIKNFYTKQTQSILRLNSNLKMALTGTPVENRLSELWSIINFLNPNFLGTWNDFRANFSIPIERYNDSECSERLRKLVSPFILRRLKTDKTIISDLPEKQEIKTYCNLTKEQSTLYQAIVKESLEKIEGSEGIARKGNILGTLIKLKQLCNHPVNFLKDNSFVPNRSGKLNRLTEMLEEIVNNNEKCLIFTQFKEMGDILKKYLQETFNKEVLFLHGGVRRKVREEIINKFQSDKGDCNVFILSLKAGGIGLNLTSANHVIHFDRWWNPAVENQATDRAFRIGQVKNVFVYKFICQGTVEENIDLIIENKKKLSEMVISSGESWLTELSNKGLREIFTLRNEAFEEV